MPIPHPQPALSLTHDLLRVLAMDTWWNFGHEFCPPPPPLVVHMKGRWLRSGVVRERPHIAAYASWDVQVWSALLTWVIYYFLGVSSAGLDQHAPFRRQHVCILPERPLWCILADVPYTPPL